MKKFSIVMMVLMMVFAIYGMGCEEDTEADPSECFDLYEKLQDKLVDCWGDDCGGWEDNDQDHLKDACECTKDGEFFYIEVDDDGDQKTECMKRPSSDYDWCFFMQTRWQTLSKDELDNIEDACNCYAKDGGYFGVPVGDDKPDCYSDKETYCFETNATSTGYANCMCTATKMTKESAMWITKHVNGEEGNCVTYNACLIEKAGMEKHLAEGSCEEIAEWNAGFYFHDPDDGGSDDFAP